MGSRGKCLQILAILIVKVVYVMCSNDNCTVGRKASLDYDVLPMSINQTIILLNLVDSALCNCTLNTWSFCYRAAGNPKVSANSNISVGIWRADTNESTYTLVNETLTALPEGEQYGRFDILCRKIIVPPFNTLEGDIVGAVVQPVIVLPAVVSVVGFDPSSKIWMSQTSDVYALTSSQLEAIESQGLYVEALYTTTGPEEFPTMLTTTSTTAAATTMESEESSPSQNVWAIYAFAVALFCLVILTMVVTCLCIVMVRRQRRGKESVSTSHGNTILTNVGIAPSQEKNKEKAQDRLNHSALSAETNGTTQVDYTALRDILPSPIVIENTNTNRESSYHQEAGGNELSMSNSKVRSHTFTYPPPENKPPSPPPDQGRAERRASDLDVVLQRPLPLSPLSASSLPNLLSDQGEDNMYDNVKSPVSAKASRSPAPGRNESPRTRNSAPPSRTKPSPQTFKFPPPVTKPPAPPSEDDIPPSDGRESSHSQDTSAGTASPDSTLVSAVSLPDLYSKHEDTYDKVLASPSPYIDCKPRSATVGSGQAPTPSQAPVLHSNPNRRRSSGSGSTKTAPLYKNTKPKLGRLQSAPIQMNSPEYAEPISPEQRARFYSHRGMKVPVSIHKRGPVKAPASRPPSERPRTLAPPQHGSISRMTSSCENLLSGEHSLEKIPEVEETEVQSPTSSSQNGASSYLEPVKSAKPRNSKSSTN